MIKYAFVISLILHLFFVFTIFANGQKTEISRTGIISSNMPIRVKFNKIDEQINSEQFNEFREKKELAPPLVEKLAKKSLAPKTKPQLATQPQKSTKTAAKQTETKTIKKDEVELIKDSQVQTVQYVENPTIKGKRIAPKYPKRALMLKQEGITIVKVLVSEVGQVKEVETLQSSGYNLLDRAAQKAVSQWEFEPFYIADMATSSWVKIPIEFKIK